MDLGTEFSSQINKSSSIEQSNKLLFLLTPRTLRVLVKYFSIKICKNGENFE